MELSYDEKAAGYAGTLINGAAAIVARGCRERRKNKRLKEIQNEEKKGFKPVKKNF